MPLNATNRPSAEIQNSNLDPGRLDAGKNEHSQALDGHGANASAPNPGGQARARRSNNGPVSHVSSASTIPLPQTLIWHLQSAGHGRKEGGRQTSVRLPGGSHSSPGSSMPFP